ncbi:hypothetical protein C8R46DRAFT_1351224 [Mycena filopes]|nr:hypothetical protein C8R46DRAFT_1351224 [Mycena filopes]
MSTPTYLESIFIEVLATAGKDLVIKAFTACPEAITNIRLRDLRNRVKDEEEDVRNACKVLWYAANFARHPKAGASQEDIEDQIEFIHGRCSKRLQRSAQQANDERLRRSAERTLAAGMRSLRSVQEIKNQIKKPRRYKHEN